MSMQGCSEFLEKSPAPMQVGKCGGSAGLTVQQSRASQIGAPSATISGVTPEAQLAVLRLRCATMYRRDHHGRSITPTRDT